MTKAPIQAALLLLLHLLSLSSRSSAQHPNSQFDLKDHRIPVTSLQGQWRFHTGDDPTWANPGFDDSTWSSLNSYSTWAQQGYKGYGGLAWYRFKITVPANLGPLSLELPPINTCYQLFADGQLIGTYGKMPPHPIPYADGVKHVYPLPAPAQADTPAHTIQIAIRVWEWPAYAALYGGGPLYGGAIIGGSPEIENIHTQYLATAHWARSSTAALGLLETLAALGALALFLLRRSEREYLWFALIMLCSASIEGLKLSYTFTSWPIVLHNQLEAALLGPCLMLAEIAFYDRFLKGRRTTLFKLAVACSLIAIPFNILGGLLNMNIAHWYLGQDLLRLPTYLWILALLFTRAYQNFPDARLLIAPVVLQKSSLLFQQFSILAFALGLHSPLSFWITLTYHPFEIQLVQVVDALFLLTMLAILVFRFSRTRSLEERYAAEVSEARSVQQFLIPRHLPQVPHLRFESEYRPAREVGGDFFQIIPDASGDSVLILVGDVAGKGLQAGMLATLLVGALRTAAAFTTDPAQILHTLNNRLCGQGNATCQALRITADGTTTLVNAGHLPPYRNGIELPIEGSLPLGTIPNIDFPVMNFTLAAGDALILMSDGIAEAQNHRGELFGFDRITAMLQNKASAATLADAAQSFGQSDDITVLTILA